MTPVAKLAISSASASDVPLDALASVLLHFDS